MEKKKEKKEKTKVEKKVKVKSEKKTTLCFNYFNSNITIYINFNWLS